TAGLRYRKVSAEFRFVPDHQHLPAKLFEEQMTDGRLDQAGIANSIRELDRLLDGVNHVERWSRHVRVAGDLIGKVFLDQAMDGGPWRRTQAKSRGELLFVLRDCDEA